MRLSGVIVHGKQLGRTIGFPTANLRVNALPPDTAYGVYAARITIDGVTHGCMLNIGRHPTVPEGPRSVEANIFDFADDVYGRSAQIETIAFLRGEVRFPSVEALKAQLERDRTTAKTLLKRAAE